VSPTSAVSSDPRSRDVFAGVPVFDVRLRLPTLRFSTREGNTLIHTRANRKADLGRGIFEEESLRVYRAIIEAEKARAKGDHDGMVAQRRLLKQLAPGVFLEYMGRL
jgi:hypothetical protein